MTPPRPLPASRVMTPEEHAQQKARVIASEMLSPGRAQRHGVYANRKAPVVEPVARVHVYVIPVVTERPL